MKVEVRGTQHFAANPANEGDSRERRRTWMRSDVDKVCPVPSRASLSLSLSCAILRETGDASLMIGGAPRMRIKIDAHRNRR